MSGRLSSTLLQPIQRGPVRRWWQQCVVWLIVLSFILLLVSSALHRHTALDAHDCAVCSAVLHQVVDLPPPPLVCESSFILLYYILCVTPHVGPYVAALLLPPSCGPPSSLS